MLRLSCLLAAAAAVRDAEADMDRQLQMFGYCKLVPGHLMNTLS